MARSLEKLSPDARSQLLRVLTSPSNVRADVIRQFHDRGATDMVELLVLCEEDDFKRATMVQALHSLDPDRPT
jgi:ACT domain-containing protein